MTPPTEDHARPAAHPGRGAPGPAPRDDFACLAELHRRELQAYCYRMLGSFHDAEDVVQETLFRAWRGRDAFAGRAPVRAWLYRIATNACLDLLRRRPRRVLPAALHPAAPAGEHTPAPVHEPIWLEPYPDELLDAAAPDPEAIYTTRESVALAFLAAIQYLSPRQRAVLLLRDVVGWPAAEVAALLETSVASVTSALQRARASLARRYPNGRGERDGGGDGAAPGDGAQRLLARYVHAWEEGDLPALVALLREDVVMSMPPDALWFSGREAVASFLAATILAGDARGRIRLRPTRANGQPAFVLFARASASGAHQPLAIMVLSLAPDGVAAITGFTDPRLFPRFGVTVGPTSPD